MKNHLLSLCLIGLSALSYAQVGVGTNDPKSTLHIIGSPAVAATPDGVIPPIISRTNLIAKTGYTTSQKGAIVYVDDITGTAPTVGSSTEKVTSIGYYYFDGTIWNKLNSTSTPVTASNGLTKDATSGDVQLGGTLTKATTVDQVANTLAFTGTAVNAFSVDGTTLSVDAANNRLGLGTTAPTSTLHVVGDTKITNLPASASSSTPVYWNSSTGQIQAMATGKKPFNTYKYTVTLSDSDWISDLNLNISTTDYTVIVTSAQFRLLGDVASTATAMGGVSLNNKSIATVNGGLISASNAQTQLQKLTVADKDVHLFQSGGTWRIYADYKDAAPLSTTTYEWVFEILVINNSMVKVGTPKTGALGISSVGSISAPTDL